MGDASPRQGIDIDVLYTEHREDLLRWFVRRTGDAETALDLWAETFAQAIASGHRFRGAGAEMQAGWLYGIARNQLATYLRRGKAEQRAMRRLGLERPPVSDALLEEIETRAGLNALRETAAQALSTLSEPVRKAVELRVVDELGYQELASRLRISEVAARARVSRGLATLADAIDESTIKETLAP